MAFLTEDDDAFAAVLSFVDDFSADGPSSEAVAVDVAALEELLRGEQLGMPLIRDIQLQVDGGEAGATVTGAAEMNPPLRRSSRLFSKTNNCNSKVEKAPEALRSSRRAATSTKKKILRKTGVYGDPNRARNERKLEIAYLREKVGQLETKLHSLQEHSSPAAAMQRTRGNEELCDSQIKVAKSLESILLKRAQQQVAECSASIQRSVDIACPSGRTRLSADRQWSRLDGVDTAGRSNARREATWNYFKGSKKHRGTLYAKQAQSLDTPYTIIEHFSKELVAGYSSTDVRIKQIVRRYVEADREVVVWVASIEPVDMTQKPFGGFKSRHRNYAVIKRARASTPQHELSLLQLVSHGMLDTQAGTIYDPKYVRALTDFLLNDAARNIKADQQLIENVLMDQMLRP
ncbi:hypothetical protein PF005_g21478 [Phytophthora fragariae]|uniref:M96 mating-specific protein family n=1 Tax=Phytophthora fragariae TaxID=53985 RepID=A0A6A3IYI8_9STRA|nr:hypothetical protein PF009_g21573 [Phytophthora fragariae]KAE8986807.1 hypothetical protein PF011_g19841 [Phytophthora fragariae]KAE9086353.1 hypothetical protein PF007_g20804 [Phytophthora fragariae]KAE9108194.1 hypothetical protein PF006_g20933 [Phytophthora fragariae]KAE9184909.1 hypothetical protein PF005_g21478 [Phytophthora fragariae]